MLRGYPSVMERLSGLDASFLYFETPRMHMHVVATIVLDASTMPHGYSFDAIRSLVESRLHLVKPFTNGALVAVVDGLGHGDEAIAVARIAIHALEEQAEQSVITLVKHCHEALAETRGVVLTLASFNSLDSTMSWLGVLDRCSSPRSTCVIRIATSSTAAAKL